MAPRSFHRIPPRRNPRSFAAATLVAFSAAMTLVACGPRDEAPLAGGGAAVAPTTSQVPAVVAAAPQSDLARVGSPVPAVQTPPAATTPAGVATAPAAAPMTVPVAPAPAAAPTYAPPPPVAVAQAAPQDSAVRPAPSIAEPPAVPRNRVGAIVAIEPIRTRPQGSGAGAVIGGVLGGVIGNQFGHGLGRAAMTGVGAAGGAIAGNNVERNYKEGVAGYRVRIRLDNGNTRTFERKNIGNLHVGDRVRLDANGFRRS